MKKINIKINQWTYDKIKNLDDNSIDKNLNLLMDIIEEQMPAVNYGEKTKTINAYEDTCQRLDSFKLTLGESRDNVITRMLILFDEINNFAEMEIPFKLTSPLNQDLVLEGMVTSNGVSILTEDDSVEYKAWLKLLNWEEIRSLVLEHEDERITLNMLDYRLDIN